MAVESVDVHEQVLSLAPRELSLPQTSFNINRNLEDLTLVWLDSNKDDYLNSISTLRCIINYTKFFTNPIDCLNYITSINKEKLFLVISGQFGKEIVPLIFQLPQVASIYIFCIDLGEHKKWVKVYEARIKGFFINKDLLFQKLIRDVKLYSKSLSSISTYSLSSNEKKQKSLGNLTKEDHLFVYSQLLAEIFLQTKRTLDENTARQELLQACRTYYQENQLELGKIEEFENTYRETNAITWYTKDCFLYRLINKALRTENIDIIFKFRFFIADLHKQIKELHSVNVKNPKQKRESLTVYHGQLISADELKQLTVNSLISFNTFLSTTTSREVALMFAGDNCLCVDDFRSILFELEIEWNSYASPFVNISHLSSFADEDEYLFSIGSIFRIESIENLVSGTSHVRLFLDHQISMNIKNTLELFGDYLNGTQINLLEKFLSETGSDCVNKQRNIQQLLKEFEKTASYHLAVFYVHTGFLIHSNYRMQLEYYEKALDAIPVTNRPMRALMYNSIAVVYYTNFDYKSALDHYELAIKANTDAYLLNEELNEKISQIYDECSSSLGLKTLINSEKFIQDRIRANLSDNDPALASYYDQIARIYEENQLFELALENFKKAILSYQQYLPSNHLKFRDLYERIGNVYVGQSHYVWALKNYEKAKEFCLADDQPLCEKLKKKIEKVNILREKQLSDETKRTLTSDDDRNRHKCR
ncbi:unnamed protein product [Didymodactylos carnosus]|uniref:ADP ribosyltransferase domain-containing protein n=1 Tax=Didymodactylos carnosus TaxID=1234261 RepID=A0A814FPM2_9BILA|nr:unnamed protein product [Didymodactylos carnosus]CAF3758750.1 unnamed protein product [Didymodactylos carnosus]